MRSTKKFERGKNLSIVNLSKLNNEQSIFGNGQLILNDHPSEERRRRKKFWHIKFYVSSEESGKTTANITIELFINGLATQSTTQKWPSSMECVQSMKIWDILYFIRFHFFQFDKLSSRYFCYTIFIVYLMLWQFLFLFR